MARSWSKPASTAGRWPMLAATDGSAYNILCQDLPDTMLIELYAAMSALREVTSGMPEPALDVCNVLNWKMC